MRSPRTNSCNTRARPRVESFSSLVAWKLGHMTPPAAVVLTQPCSGKRVVATRAWVSFSRQTAASSEVSVPTSRSGNAAAAGRSARMSRSTAGDSLQPQPPPWDSCDRRIGESVVISGILSRRARQG